MRRTLPGVLILMLLGASLVGCKPTSSAPASGETSATAPAPTQDIPPKDAPTKDAPTKDAPTKETPTKATPVAPSPTGPCSPDSSAADLPSAPYGSGITLKPPQPGGTPEQPWLGYLSIGQIETWASGSSLIGNVYVRKGGTVTVDTGEFGLTGSLMPAPPAAWYDTHLKLEGIQPAGHQFTTMGDSGHFNLRMPAGQAGDAFRLTIQDVRQSDGSNGDVTITFCRKGPPQAAITYRAKDGWHPVASRVPADSPLVLRLAFTDDMLPETVERSLRGPHDKEDHSQGDWITSLAWLDARTVELTTDRPVPVMRLNLHGAQDKYGLFVSGGLPNLYTGDPPQVLAVDPVSGQKSRLADVPPEPLSGILSPDGQWLRVSSQQIRGGYSTPDWQSLLVDLTTGTAQPLKPGEMSGYWLPSGDLLTFAAKDESTIVLIRQRGTEREETVLSDLPRYQSIDVSPDGQWIALLVRSDVKAEYPYVGVRFLIVSRDGKIRQTLPGDLLRYSPGKDGIILYGPTWSPDSTRIALTQPGNGGADLVVADVAAGELRTLAKNLPGIRDRFDPVTWSPDGSKLLVGPLLLDATTGQVLRRIEGLQGRPFWSRDGEWLLSQSGEWTEITAYNLRTGKSTSLGDGMALGWSPDGKALLIHWPDAAHRTIWGY